MASAAASTMSIDSPFALTQRPHLFAGDDLVLSVEHGPHVACGVSFHLAHVTGGVGLHCHLFIQDVEVTWALRLNLAGDPRDPLSV